MKKNRQILTALLFCFLFQSTTACANMELGSNVVHLIENTSSSMRLSGPKDKTYKIAILADNAGAETTDLIIPYSVLKESNLSEVYIVATEDKPVQLMPALKLQADLTIAEFDHKFPTGADIIIVPAMHSSDNPLLIEWLKKQKESGSFIVSICEGAWILAHAGLLDGKNATTHWYAFDKISKDFPKTRWVKNKRYIIDGNIMTTAGISASIPASLKILEAISGVEQAQRIAEKLSILNWDDQHQTSEFYFSSEIYLTAAKNMLIFWNHDKINLPIADGFDEIALALSADAWSRTYRSQAYVIAENKIVRSKNGLKIYSDNIEPFDSISVDISRALGVLAITTNLEKIKTEYGQNTAEFVRLQLEYK